MVHKKFSFFNEVNRKKFANRSLFSKERILSDFLCAKSVDVVRA